MSSGTTTKIGQLQGDKFDKRLDKATARFFALTARASLATEAEDRLSAKLGVTLVSLDELMIEEIKAFSAANNADWDSILEVDSAGPEGKHWKDVMLLLARKASDRVLERLLNMEGTIVVSRAGLLARYGCLDMLGKLRRQIEEGGADHSLEGLWLLLPTSSGGGLPKIDGKPVPVLDENEWTHIPSEWIRASL